MSKLAVSKGTDAAVKVRQVARDSWPLSTQYLPNVDFSSIATQLAQSTVTRKDFSTPTDK